MDRYVFSERTQEGRSITVSADRNGASIAVIRDNRASVAPAPAGAGYRGTCYWTQDGQTLEVHEISAQPQGRRLGAILMWVATVQARKLGCARIATTATARDAYRFYLDLGLHPSPDADTHAANMIPLTELHPGVPFGPGESDQNPGPKQDFGIRMLLGRMATATWSGEREDVKMLALESLMRGWTLDDAEDDPSM